MNFLDEFHGPNAGYVLELYDRYRRDPASVDEATRAAFARWRPPEASANGHGPAVPSLAVDKVVGVAKLARAVRGYGHLAARLDPLGSDPPGDPSLELATYGLSDDDLRALPAALIGGPITERTANALEALRELRAVYCGTLGFDADHIWHAEERDWLRHAAESRRFRAQPNGVALLERLTQVEAFEQFLQRAFPGKTRFSIEGVGMLVPLLDEIIGCAADDGLRHILLGMAHRGRLNVLAHILDKPYAQILAEFKDPARPRSRADDELGWTGDVKYHSGARHAEEAVNMVIALPANPSHLEAVDPVVVGMARAAGTSVAERGAVQFDPAIVLPILIHGDAAFSAQGVVAETLTLSRVPGWRTGGTVHIITNNQLGFTATPAQSRSTLYASDLAKGFEIPIVHVNADDPIACLEAARLAYAYRAQFHKDFVIDLIGYRRYGHNEGDEPSFTQPLMYRAIEQHPSVRALWAESLVNQGVIERERAEALVHERMEALQRTLEGLQPEAALAEPLPEPPPAGAARRVQTAVPLDVLRALNDSLAQLPEGFTLHPKLERPLGRRRNAFDEPDKATIEWATAEALAFASILADGIAIRLTGEDVERGTFSHRHAVLHDFKTGATHLPLQALPQARAAFEVRNSPLSEFAAVGFEYGYSLQAPERLVLWEAQYGDFINAAQVVVDEFIASARAKWGQTSGLVLLLPHAFEGQGPDHSSARLERFLSLAADINLRLAYPTTAAQYFHLLRRQAALLAVDPLPLIVMTPKSLLRHPQTASTARELADGKWQPVIDDPRARTQPDQITRLILCSGKVYVDLVTGKPHEQHPEVAIARVEQLYPFRPDEFEAVLAYPNLREVVWVQEEPENMGAWEFIRPRLEAVMRGRWPLRLVSRPRSASPAEGSSARHAANQSALIERAFESR